MTKAEYDAEVLRTYEGLMTTLGASRHRWIAWVYRNTKRRLEHLEKIRNEAVDQAVVNRAERVRCGHCGLHPLDFPADACPYCGGSANDAHS